MRSNSQEKIELSQNFIGLLKDFLSISAKTTPNDIDDLVSNVPFGKIIGLVYKLNKIRERLGTPEEALYTAIILSVLQSIEETVVEFGCQEDQIKEYLEKLKSRSEEEKIKFEALVLEGFTTEDLLSHESELYKEIKKFFLEPIEYYIPTNFQDFSRHFREKLRLNFWRVIEENRNMFQCLLEEFGKESYREALKRYKIERYYKEILDEFGKKPIFENEKKVTLKDIYVNPEFRIYNKCINEKLEYKELKDKFFQDDIETFSSKKDEKFLIFKSKEKRDLHSFIYSLLRGDLEDSNLIKPSSPFVILLLGYPGEGKSSFCKKLIYDYKTHQINLDKDIYLITLKRIKYNTKLMDDPLDILKEELESLIDSTIENFNNSILLLDGLDELSIKERILEKDIDQLVEEIIFTIERKKLNLKVIITSRHGYLNFDDLLKKKKNSLLVLELRGLDKEKQIKWVKKFTKFYPEKKNYVSIIEKIWTNTKRFAHVIELLNQPIFLYMIVSMGLDIENSNLRKKDLYEEFVKFVVERKWDSLGRHHNLQGLGPEILSEVLEEIAFLIFKSDYEYAHKKEILKCKSLKEFYRSIGISWQERKDITGFSNILRGLLISFYFREVEKVEEDDYEEGRENFAVEFFHKSIQEYMTAKYFTERMKELIEKQKKRGMDRYIKSNEEALNTIWDCFSHKPISEEIREYLREILNDLNIEEKKELTERLETLFKSLLEIDFILKPEELKGKFPLYKSFYVFRNFWIFARLLNNDFLSGENKILTSELRQRFVDFIYYIQYNPKTFIPFIPLDRLDLNKVNLQGVNLKGADLCAAILEGANLAGANLAGANLEKAELKGANLAGANLVGTNLAGADLAETCLEGTNLVGANLRGTCLAKAKGLSYNLEWYSIGVTP